jgi:hypothetical protein
MSSSNGHLLARSKNSRTIKRRSRAASPLATASKTVRTQDVGGVLEAENDALFEEFGVQYCPATKDVVKG